MPLLTLMNVVSIEFVPSKLYQPPVIKGQETSFNERRS